MVLPAKENEQAAPNTNAAATTSNDAVAVLDPELIMAARRGDIKRLKELLKLKDDEGQVVVDVDHSPRPRGGASSSLRLDGVTSNEGDSLLHVVAACGDGGEFLRCAEMIHDNKEGLLVARNNRGGTPLHCAAGAGHAEMISYLVALAARGGETAAEEFLRMRNDCGETALHQAVRATSMACIDSLMSMDPELACVPREGEEGASPLYLAISLGELDIARHLLEKSNGRLSYSGPDGQNVLHAVFSHVQVLPKLFEWSKDVPPHLMQRYTDGLLSQLAAQREKQTGSNPLHIAVSFTGWRQWSFLRIWFPRVRACLLRAVGLLLDANICCVYQTDKEGLYPIHVAAMNGYNDDGFVKLLVRRCPDCATLRDTKGRTFLHVAVEKQAYGVVRYACRAPQLSSLLNVQDNEGDTALHRAIDVGNVGVFNCLIRNPHVRLDVSNNKAEKPLDLAWAKIPPKINSPMNATRVIHRSLAWLGAPCGESRADLFRKEHMAAIDEDKESKSLTNETQTMGILSVLVATVTFASAFTLPGGYVQSASDGVPGTPVLAGSYAFDAFILADILAFICSCLATFNLMYVGSTFTDISIRLKYQNISESLMRSSIRSLVVAFALGLYLVLAPLAHSQAIKIVVWVIISASMLYGNMEAWKFICAGTAYARLGAKRAAVLCMGSTIFYLSVHFGSFIIIFGVPAIRWIKVHHTS
ncbi:hypothetical protein ACP70R_042110 [Stipagrostis hirtigluma subsp. patula]